MELTLGLELWIEFNLVNDGSHSGYHALAHHELQCAHWGRNRMCFVSTRACGGRYM